MNVRVPCDRCGDVTIPIRDLNVRFCVDNSDTSYWFRCPDCLSLVASEVHPTKRVELLTHPSIRAEPWFMPEELREPHCGPPITERDVLVFHLELNG